MLLLTQRSAYRSFRFRGPWMLGERHVVNRVAIQRAILLYVIIII